MTVKRHVLTEWQLRHAKLNGGGAKLAAVLRVTLTAGIDYKDYRFGRAKQRFRGPKPNLERPYIAFIGGSETYGKFIHAPFPTLIEDHLGIACANWGTPGAGPSFFLKDPVLLEACSNARICVISIMGAVSMSNRLYTVFKRRNSRLRSTTDSLRALYPDLELSDFRFAHNMLHRMHQENPDNFKLLEIELREAWVARMKELLDDIETVRVLLWMSTRTPDEPAKPEERESYQNAPAFVTREMLERVAPMADLVVEYVAADEVAADPEDGRVFEPAQKQLAALYPGETMHQQTADLLAQPLRDVLASRIKI